MSWIKLALHYGMGALTDPITGRLSGTRFGGLVCLIIGNALALFRPNPPAIVATLITGGAVAFYTRTRSDAGAP